MPRAERVRREAGVDHRERRAHPLVGQFGVVLGELFGGEQPLVDDGLAVERADVESLSARRAAVLDPALDGAARLIQSAVEPLAVGIAGGGEKHLLDARLRVEGSLAKFLVVRLDCAPRQHVEAVLGKHLVDQLTKVAGGGLVGREKHSADGVLAGRRQRDIEFIAVEPVGDLQENPRAVTGVRISAGRAAVFEVAEQLQPLGYRLVARLAVEVEDDSDPAVRTRLVGGSEELRRLSVCVVRHYHY